MNYLLLAFTNPAKGREDDFNAWYDNDHLREVVEYGSGMIGGRRYRRSEQQRPGQEPPPFEYTALYDAQWTSVDDYLAQRWKADSPALTPWDGLLGGDPQAWFYEELGQRVERADLEADGAAGPRGDRTLFITLANALPGGEAAFNAWYDEFHLKEMVTLVPGIVAGQRYRVAKSIQDGQPTSPWEYATIYETSSDEDINEALRRTRAEASMTAPPPGTLDPQLLAWVYCPIGSYEPQPARD